MTFEELTARIKAGLSAAGIDAAAFEAGEIVKFYGGKRFCPVGDGTVSAALVAQKRQDIGRTAAIHFGRVGVLRAAL